MLRKSVFKMWSQICGKKPVSPQKLLKKISKTKKKNKNVHNLWQLIRKKLVLLVNFGDPI